MGKRAAGKEEGAFVSARPIWPEGMELEKNLTVGFRARFVKPAGGKAVLRIAASSLYRAYINGRFLAHGPARGPHGYFRVDEWDLGGSLKDGENLVAIEVAGYNINSYYLLDQPAFLQAEVVSEGRVLASTAGEGTEFEAGILKERIRKVLRYSYQRPFTEAYRLKPGFDRWRKSLSAEFDTVKLAELPPKKLLPRRVPYPLFHMRWPAKEVSRGEFESGCQIDKVWREWSINHIGTRLKGFKEEELEADPQAEVQKTRKLREDKIDSFFAGRPDMELRKNQYRILDFGTNLTGFIGLKLSCGTPSRILLTFDEMLTEGDIDLKRLGCNSGISWEMPAGSYELESFEPYTLKYLKVWVFEGDCHISDVYIREYANPDVDRAHFSCSDVRLNRLFEAGKETYRQNAVDIFMDCPSRERAGWLCDSFFTARTAFALSGNTLLEKNFLENYLLPESFDNLPEGMIPMCYPADTPAENPETGYAQFIPNWAMWFIIQLEEYFDRSRDRELVNSLKPRVLGILDYLKAFRNEYGLLEKLDGWIMIEWSAANRFVQDVNFPTNMLYAAALSAAGRLYGMPELLEEADALRDVMRRMSFNGSFFVDNAVREGGSLKATNNMSEVCQYYAFFSETATPETHRELWQILREDFGPGRKHTGAYPQVHMANAFIGNYLRLELLSRYGETEKLLKESVQYLLYMADSTGTLWENDHHRASCNHGFASHIVYSLYRDALGIYDIDVKNRLVRLKFSDPGIDWCEGRIPLAEGPVSLSWRLEGDTIYYRLSMPAGYSLAVEKPAGKKLVRR